MSDFSCLCCSLRLNYLFNHLSCSFWPARSIKSPTKKNKSYVFVVKRHDFGSKSSQNPIFLQFFVSNHKIILKVTFKTNIQNQKNDMTENQKCKKNVIVFFDKNDFCENNYTYTVKPDLTTTCEQRPPVNNGQFESSTASQNLSFIRYLCLTAAFFRSQGWPLYTGLTVFIIFLFIFKIL